MGEGIGFLDAGDFSSNMREKLIDGGGIFFVFGLLAEILRICAFDRSKNLTEIYFEENLCSLILALSVLK